MASSPARSILVLEDDELSCDVVRCILQAADFKVICARQFDEAMYHIDYGTKFDAALVDLKMPPGTPNGISFVRRAQIRCPTLKVVFMSAHLSSKDFRLFDEQELFLRKPFAPYDLLGVVTRAAA